MERGGGGGGVGISKTRVHSCQHKFTGQKFPVQLLESFSFILTTKFSLFLVYFETHPI